VQWKPSFEISNFNKEMEVMGENSSRTINITAVQDKLQHCSSHCKLDGS
jgi:hypothetical protein